MNGWCILSLHYNVEMAYLEGRFGMSPSQGMNMTLSYLISQKQQSTVGQCEEAKRGFVILCGLLDSPMSVQGHMRTVLFHKQGTHTYTHSAHTGTSLKI